MIATGGVVLQALMEGIIGAGAGEAVEVDPQTSEEVPGTKVAQPNSVQLRERCLVCSDLLQDPRKKDHRWVD